VNQNDSPPTKILIDSDSFRIYLVDASLQWEFEDGHADTANLNKDT